jgi:hypothetical protein
MRDTDMHSVKALASKTPYKTPGSLSRLQLSGGGIGTPQRVKSLRDDCLERDRHRCVVTRKISIKEAQNRLEKDEDNLKDNDRESLLPERNEMAYLEVSHIFPHPLMSLTRIGGEQKLVRTLINACLWSLTYSLPRLSLRRWLTRFLICSILPLFPSLVGLTLTGQ